MRHTTTLNDRQQIPDREPNSFLAVLFQLIAAVFGTIRLATTRLRALPSWVLLTQVFIALGWLRAFTEKLIDPNWWSGTVLAEFVIEHEQTTIGWYQPFIDWMVVPLAVPIALAVMVAQLFAGLSLLSGRNVGSALATGMFLNLNFVATGAVTPSVFYLLAQGAVVLWMAERKLNKRTVARLGIGAVVAVFLAGLSFPFISTVHPAEVIEDPAAMFVFGGSLAALACLVAIDSGSRSHRNQRNSARNSNENISGEFAGTLSEPHRRLENPVVR